MEKSSLIVRDDDYRLLFTPEHKKNYRQLDPKDLQQLFSEKSQELGTAYEESKKICHPGKSYEYSIVLANAENLVEELKEIEEALNEKNEKPEEKSDYLPLACLEEMQKNLPSGERALLQTDLRVLAPFFNRPVDETYESSRGLFYNPKVSPSEISKWLIPYISEGMYESTDCNFKTDNIGNEIFFDEMATCIGLVKKNEQREMLEKNLQEPKKNGMMKEGFLKVYHYFTSSRQNKVSALDAPTSQEILDVENKNISNEDIIQIQPYGKQSLYFVKIPAKTEKLSRYTEAQQQVIEKLKSNLPDILENWNFSRFEIFTTDQLLELKYDRESSCSADVIVFFHKPVPKNETPKE